MTTRPLRLALPFAAAALIAAAVLVTVSGSDGQRSASAAVPKRPDVIVLLFDEFVGDTLLGRDGRIDAVRYPNFAALARDGYWFPNAFSSYDSTSKAIPLLLDGKKPVLHNPPDRRGHPRSIYDMFARRGYRFVNSEAATALCPRRYCGGSGRKPRVLPQLGGGRRPERLERFITKIEPGRPTFYLQHVLLPHVPYQYLPSGHSARRGGRDLLPRMNGVPSYHDRFLTQHNYQRYLLQLGFVDHELGKLLRRLKRLDMYENTLIALTADQATALSEVGIKDRRKVNEHNVDEVASVPMIIKAPGQQRGKVDRAYMQTMDFTPTLADILNFRLPYRADGVSAFSRRVRKRRQVFLPTRFFERTIRISARRYEARRRVNTRRRLRWFGSGAESLFTGIGPNRALLGRRLSELRLGAASRVSGRILAADELLSVRRSSGVVPTQIVGNLKGGRGKKHDIAVAVNGRVEAVGRSWYLRGDRMEHFAVNVPESSLPDGRNVVEVFEVGRDGTLHLMARV